TTAHSPLRSGRTAPLARSCGHRAVAHAAGVRNSRRGRAVSVEQPRPDPQRAPSRRPRTGARMTRRTALRIIVFAAVIGLAAQALLLDNLLGVNAPLLATALLGAAFVLRPRDRRMDPLDWWLPPTALAMSAAIALRADPTLLLLDLGPACGLLGASIAALAGEAVTRRSAVRVVELALLVLGWAGIGILRVTAAARRPDPTAVQGLGLGRP